MRAEERLAHAVVYTRTAGIPGTRSTNTKIRRQSHMNKVVLGLCAGAVLVAGVVLAVTQRPVAPPMNAESLPAQGRVVAPVGPQSLGNPQIEQRIAELSATIDALSELIGQEIVARQEIEQRLEELTAARADQPSGSRRRGAIGVEAFGRFGRSASRQISVDNLVEAGFRQGRALQLKTRVDEMNLARINLQQQAVREGWIDTPRFAEEMRTLGNPLTTLRSELGEQDYDRFLYGSGMPNRVVVNNVLEGSAAAQAGLRPGDSILRYDGERTYFQWDLRRQSRSGDMAAPVPLQVVRDGQLVELVITRGPLGVGINSERTPPP